MTFITLIIVFVIVQYLGSGKVLHHDAWLSRWIKWLSSSLPKTKYSGVLTFSVLLVPVVVVAMLQILAFELSEWAVLLVTVPVLLYSLGRGDFSQYLNDYLDSWKKEDFQGAYNTALQYNFLNNETEVGTWGELHQKVFGSIAYISFERLFAVVFWFVLLGAPGAILYRLSFLLLNDDNVVAAEKMLVAKWIWLLEWLPVRFLGLTFALTGSFVGCISNWRENLLCPKTETELVLSHHIRGALDIDEKFYTEERCSTCLRQLECMRDLLSRSYIFWLCVMAVLVLL